MTQPHITGPGSVTDKLISSVLTVMVEELERGATRDRITDLVGVELLDPLIDLHRMRLLAACALSRLAVMHHAAEQLADVFDGEIKKTDDDGRRTALAWTAGRLRKLVDDHD